MANKSDNAPELKAIESIIFITNNLISRFNKDNNPESFLDKKVSKVSAKLFKKILLSYRPYLNELSFITAGMNYKFTRVLMDAIQKLDEEGQTIILSGGTNQSLITLIEEEAKRIVGAIKRLQRDPSGYKVFVKHKKHDFDYSVLFRLVDSIQISQSINVFINELNGGDNALALRQRLLKEKSIQINLYGIDRDIKKGLESKKKGIHTARGGLVQVSRKWADIGFCTNHNVPFFKKETEEVNDVLSFYKMNVIRPGGLMVFNYPFYRMNDIKHILESNKLIAALNTKDKLGNLLFVVQVDSETTTPKEWLEYIEFSPSSLPTSLKDYIEYTNNEALSVEKFRAKYIDLNDMISELDEDEDSAQFLIDCFSTHAQTKQAQIPLIEYKLGHIPAIATSEILNGRYVDEVLETKMGKSFQFDHLFSTKIVKREIEETVEQTDKSGNPVTLVKSKKNNYIISTALTTQGDYIELFSTEKVSDDEIV